MSLFNCNADEEKTVRAPAVAGQFYSATPAALRKEIKKYIAEGNALDKTPSIIISPHAGYVFSGPVAGIGFATIDKNVKKVILLGPSHHKYFSGISIPDVDEYKTPLGNIPINKKDVKKLRANKLVHAYSDAHSREHCLEVQLPFLQVILDDFSIVPIITGDIEKIEEVADLIYPLIDSKTLLLISSDFSHYHSHLEAKEIDARSVGTILSRNPEGFLDACGEVAIRIGMHIAEKMGLSPKLLNARNSFETSPQYGTDNRVVGYVSIVYIKDGNSAGENAGSNATAEISDTDKAFMLKLARSALEKAVKKEEPPRPENIPDAAKEFCGCFVTLTKHGSLRGCIGYIVGIKPLYQAIIDNAGNAALGDPRFPKVIPDVLKDIKVEVSVLTAPVPFEYTDTEDLLKKITAHKDGIILKKGFSQATFLPQVWDQIPDKVTFLEHLAMKAGLGRNEWKNAQYKKYQAIHFEEE